MYIICTIAPVLVRIKFIKPSGPSADLGPCFYIALPPTPLHHNHIPRPSPRVYYYYYYYYYCIASATHWPTLQQSLPPRYNKTARNTAKTRIIIHRSIYYNIIIIIPTTSSNRIIRLYTPSVKNNYFYNTHTVCIVGILMYDTYWTLVCMFNGVIHCSRWLDAFIIFVQ